MKEILKYLRQTNSYTQEEIARKLDISRQSYIKYENGEVEPGEKTIRALSIIYGVREDFICKNEIPNPEYIMGEPDVPYGTSVLPDGRKIFEGLFDGMAVRILDSLEGLNIKKGQKFKLYIETEEESEKKENAYESIMEIIGKRKPCVLGADEDSYYKDMINKAREEKYGHID